MRRNFDESDSLMTRSLQTFSLAAIIAATFVTPAPAQAQDISRYLRIRHENHVGSTSSLDALKDAAGGQILEISGTVTGSCRVGAAIVLLIDRAGREAQEIETDFVPEWLVNSNTPARMIVKTIRPDEATPTRVVLLAAAKDADVSKLEAAAEAKSAASRPKRSPAVSRFAARGDGVLYGSIGRGGARLERHAAWVLPPNQVTPIYAAFIQRANPRLSSEEANVMATHIIGRCMQFKIDPRLVVSIVLVESGFDPGSVSNHGAIGLGQLMPGTAAWMGVSDSFDVTQNIYGMVKLLSTLRTMFAPLSSTPYELWQKTIAAYNAGDGAVRRYGGVPPFPVTQAYVRHVLTLWIRLAGQPS
jgi:soluble lytic murein transglycosylase-like protein